MPDTIIEYQVIDGQTKEVISTHSSMRIAARKMDRLDTIYGACRYQVKMLENWAPHMVVLNV